MQPPGQGPPFQHRHERPRMPAETLRGELSKAAKNPFSKNSLRGFSLKIHRKEGNDMFNTPRGTRWSHRYSSLCSP